jgi:olefin beta-lactone synthetase
MDNTDQQTIDILSDQDVVNISTLLSQKAHIHPYKRAVVYPVARDRKNGHRAYAHLTFLQLEKQTDMLAAGLEQAGIGRGDRTALMVNPGPDFFAITFALFKVGAIPVVVDPGMGINGMLRCLQESEPRVFIGITKAHLLRKMFPKYFRSVQTWVTVGKRWFWGGYRLNQLRLNPWKPFQVVDTHRDDVAAILFTTGSTGPAKGTVYTHGNFDAQIRHIQAHFQIMPEEIDLPTFPLFALFDPALGMTAVIPDMDPTKPAMVNPENIIEPILDHGVTNMFASPALLNRVGRYGKTNNIKLPSLKRVVSAGAPVHPSNIEQFSFMLNEDTEIHTPYGATEAVPIISIGSHEILSSTRQFSEQGYGNCIGRPLEGIDVRLIKVTDEPISQWSDDLEIPPGDIGEIIVKGDLVTREYYNRIDSTGLAKIVDGDQFWHRMGDLGWVDKTGRIWFCGRKKHRLITENGTLYSIPCEAIFNNHPRVLRSALVGLGDPPRQKPVIVIELEENDSGKDQETLTHELLTMARENPLTETIDTILFKKKLPVDIRHNSKIFREKLAEWVAKKAGKNSM